MTGPKFDILTKRCSRCLTVKPRLDFYKARKNGPDHVVMSRCKDCLRKDPLEKERHRKKALRATASGKKRKFYAHSYQAPKKYGLTLEQYEDLMATSKCEICGKEETRKSRKSLSIDHCHKTLRVRGVLCSRCNLGIGYLQDDPELLENAASYLRKFTLSV